MHARSKSHRYMYTCRHGHAQSQDHANEHIQYLSLSLAHTYTHTPTVSESDTCHTWPQSYKHPRRDKTLRSNTPKSTNTSTRTQTHTHTHTLEMSLSHTYTKIPKNTIWCEPTHNFQQKGISNASQNHHSQGTQHPWSCPCHTHKYLIKNWTLVFCDSCHPCVILIPWSVWALLYINHAPSWLILLFELIHSSMALCFNVAALCFAPKYVAKICRTKKAYISKITPPAKLFNFFALTCHRPSLCSEV